MQYKITVREDYSATDIKKFLDERVVGQEEAKRSMALLGFLHNVRWVHAHGNNKGNSLPWKQVTGKSLPPLHGLVTGPTGCGKTYIVNLVAEYLGLPVIKLDASALVPEGYRGVSFKNALAHAVESLRGQKYSDAEIDRSVVILDEFDKICASSGRSDQFYLHTQYSLLKALEGDEGFVDTDYDMTGKRKPTVRTHDMMFIVSGSFAHLTKILEEKESTIGFGAEVQKAAKLRSIGPKELEQAGLIRELAGRINVVTQILPLTKDELRQALVSEKGEAAQEFAMIFNVCERDISDVFTEEIEQRVVDNCFNSNLGARGLRAALFHELRNILEIMALPLYKEKCIDDGIIGNMEDGVHIEGVYPEDYPTHKHNWDE